MSSTPTREVISVSLQADIANIRKVLEQEMPEAGKKGAAQLLKEVSANYKAMEKAQKDTAKAIEAESKRAGKAQAKAFQDAAVAADAAAKKTGRSWNEIAKSMQSNQAISDMEQIGAMFILVGGSVSKMAMLFTSAVRPVAMLNTLLGPNAGLAAGLLAIPAAALGAVSAVKAINAAVLDLGRTAVDARDDVKGFVSPQVSAELDIMAANFATLDRQSKLLSATLAADLAPQIQETLDLTLGWSVAINDLLSGLGKIAASTDTGLWERLPTWLKLAVAPTQLFTDGIMSLGEEARITEQGKLGPLITKLMEAGYELKKTGESTSTLGRGLSLAAGRFDELGDAAKKAADASEKIGDIINESLSDLSVGPMADIIDSYNRRIDRATEAGATEVEMALAVEAAQSRMNRDINAGIEERLKTWKAATKEMRADALAFSLDVGQIVSRMEVEAQDFVQQLKQSALDSFMALGDSASQVMDLVIQLNNNAIAAAEARVARERELAQAAFDDYLTRQKASIRLQLEAGIITKKEAKAAVDAARIVSMEKEAALERIGKKEQEQAIKAFYANQNLQIAQAAIESFRAGISLIPAFAFLGPGAGIAAAATAAAAFGTAVAAIQGQSPPEFPMGRVPSRSPDHHLVGVRDDEGITTPRGTAALGGPDAIRRANEGRGGSPSVINLAIDGRVVASVNAPKGDALLRPAPGPWLGRRPLYGR